MRCTLKIRKLKNMNRGALIFIALFLAHFFFINLYCKRSQYINITAIISFGCVYHFILSKDGLHPFEILFAELYQCVYLLLGGRIEHTDMILLLSVVYDHFIVLKTVRGSLAR